MAHQLFQLPRPTAISNNLTLVSGAKVGFFLTGTSTPTDTYQDSARTTPHTNPVVADSAGRLPAIYLDPEVVYRVTFTDSADVEIYPAIDPANDQILSQAVIGRLLYPRTAAEIAAGVTPVNYTYIEGHGRRYGMVGDNVTDDSAACERWLQFCYDRDVAAVIDGGQFKIADVSISIAGGRLDNGFKITGAGKNVTQFVQLGTPTALLTIAGTNVGTPNSIQMIMRDIGFYGSGLTAMGLVLENLASLHVDNCTFDAFNVGVYLHSALIFSFYRCVISANNTGVRSRQHPTGAPNNLGSFRDCIVASNAVFGLDFGAANGIKVDGCDIEANGTTTPTSTVTISNASPAVVSWTAHGLAGLDPVIFTTTGTLPSPLVANVVYYVVPINANSFSVSTTIGGSQINTTTAGSGTHTAVSPNQGGVIIRDTCIDELGYAYFEFDSNWFETNRGAAIRSEYATSAFGLMLAVRSGHILGTGASYSFLIENARSVSIEDHWAVAGTDTASISCDMLTLKNARFITLNRPNVTWTTIENCWFNGTDYPWGETGSTTVSLTGCTTVPTGTATWLIQGRDVKITLPNLTGTSNTTAATLTGLPANLSPSVARALVGFTVDNGSGFISRITAETTGELTLNNVLGAFTAAGNKGCLPAELSYRK